jgi:hypothetical protein
MEAATIQPDSSTLSIRLYSYRFSPLQGFQTVPTVGSSNKKQKTAQFTGDHFLREEAPV